ncbi:3-keto-5-aminohexanoate cleavage protein [Herbaspirillum autotrophicum]|uniref:3-keto-5-aminohexanoate cleavage protein n=1 Tax=Herbaspirillum autotrophicum TaxID=180195 RepID=UPI00067AAC7C|nr:3-keto-5-aminohexanoate cleavage protein [Herbaspirillum autotrophicum]
MSQHTNYKSVSETPVVIEAAVTPLRAGVPLQPAEQTIVDAKACLAAGASVIHHHHDFRLPREEATQQIIHIGKSILQDYPSALIYPDYIAGGPADKSMGRRYSPHALLQPMHDAGALTMFTFDPGLTLFARLDAEGLPSDSVMGGATFAEAHEMVKFANRVNVPVVVGVYEPGNLRWICAYARAGKFPPGSLIKFYFGGDYVMGQDKVPGITFGLPPTKASLDTYLSFLDGIDMPWTVSVQGGVLLDTPLARYALERGGHLRVGVEDTAGGTDMTNPQTVEAAVALAAQVGRPVARGKQGLATLIEQGTAVTA